MCVCVCFFFLFVCFDVLRLLTDDGGVVHFLAEAKLFQRRLQVLIDGTQLDVLSTNNTQQHSAT